MAKVNADNYPRTISQYVPKMEYASDVVGDLHIAYLGAPAALDADGIWDGVSATNAATSYTSADYKTTFDGSATSLTTTAGMLDAKYGRCLQAVGSSGADHVVTVSGRDYLGQPMKENFTLSGTVPQYGNKAFKYVDSMAIAVGAASDTMDLGWTNRLGLPYKAETVVGYTEDDVSKPHDAVDVAVEVDGVRYAAGTDVVVPSPVAGQITGFRSIQTTIGNAAVNNNTVVVVATDVLGLAIQIADDQADIVTTDDDQATSRVDQYEAVGISSDGGGTGAANFLITVEPITFVAGDDTATQTATTEDTRGTILVTAACNGSVDYEVRCKVDTSELHGISQYNG